MVTHFADDQEIHLWVINHFSHVEHYLSYRELLSDEEKDKERQFATEALRKRFAVSRAVLRMLLQSYLSQPHETIEFHYGKQGKPFLANKETDLEFNLSHSHDLIAYGFARGFPIGVDIEYINPHILRHGLENAALSSFERAQFQQLDHEQKIMAFYRAWTRKEAILKADGSGLSKPLENVEVSFIAAENPQVISIDGDTKQAANWRLYNIEGIAGYCGAVAAKASTSKRKILYQSFDANHGKRMIGFMDSLCTSKN